MNIKFGECTKRSSKSPVKSDERVRAELSDRKDVKDPASFGVQIPTGSLLGMRR